MPKFTEGECHQFEGASMGYPAVACTTPGALKVTKAATETECGKAIPMAFPEQKAVYCLADPTAA